MMVLDLDNVVLLEPVDAAGRVDQFGVVETWGEQVHVYFAVGADDLGCYVLVGVGAVALLNRGHTGQLSVVDTAVKKVQVEPVTGACVDEFGIVEAGVREVDVDYVGQIRCRYQYRGLDLTDRPRGVIC